MSTPSNQKDTDRCEPISRILARTNDKWTMLVVCVLGKGPCRFNALRREVGEISQKVLASTLRDLEENGFVSRTVTPTKPPQVEYSLTELGREFLCPVRELAEWVIANTPRIEAARAEYAARFSRDQDDRVTGNRLQGATRLKLGGRPFEVRGGRSPKPQDNKRQP